VASSSKLCGGVLDWLDKARQFASDGKLEDVLTVCSPVLETEPNDIDAHHLMAIAYLGLGYPIYALPHAKRGCDLCPHDVGKYVVVTSCLVEGGNFAEALKNAENTLALAPDNSQAEKSLSRVRLRISEREQLLKSQPRSLVSEREFVALREDARSNYPLFPIVINSRDRCSCLKNLVGWLKDAGYRNLAIVDNCSTYAPLLKYLHALEGEVLVYRLSQNLGKWALWTSGLAETIWDFPFIYTDPDVLPTEDCPKAVVQRLYELLERNPQVSKAGMGLKIDDLPDHYQHKKAVVAWESQFWSRPLPGGCYDAAVDTTFALYRPRSWYQLEAVRSASPYLARHLPWYQDSSQPEIEDRYYSDHVSPGISCWSGPTIWAGEENSA
jgi:tetratricopeptide (TPR) repeat protein